MEKLINKMKNKSFWITLSGAIIMICTGIGDVFGVFVNSEAISDLLMRICEVLIILGIVKSDVKTTNTENKEKSDLKEKDSDPDEKE